MLRCYVLLLANGELADPPVFATSHVWQVGDSFQARDRSHWRIVAMSAPSPDMILEDMWGAWTVERIDSRPQPDGGARRGSGLATLSILAT
jgi:hypothetical protein